MPIIKRSDIHAGNASQIFKYYVHEMGPRSSLMKQPTIPLEGQCESLVQMLRA